MNAPEWINDISAKDFDLDEFVQRAIDEPQTRDEIVRQMITHPHIMVYYHCYYVVAKASQQRPGLFYPYWQEIASLLHHQNSYHRDFALTILANLTQVDQQDLFLEIFQGYFAHLNDEKFMTGQCCVQNSIKILRNKPTLSEQIITLLLDIDNQCTYTEKQKGVLKADVLDILDEMHAQIQNRKAINAFIKAGVNSISPKTRRKAKALVKKYHLSSGSDL